MVERLLACGHDVHVLARPRHVADDPEDVLHYLRVCGCLQEQRQTQPPLPCAT